MGVNLYLTLGDVSELVSFVHVTSFEPSVSYTRRGTSHFSGFDVDGCFIGNPL